MSIRYILGKPGSGKSFYCINEILQLAKHSKKKIFYIAPDQFTLQSEVNFINASSGEGLMQVQVFSFKRLAHYVFSKYDMQEKAVIDDVGINMLLRRVINRIEPKLKFYGNILSKSGFIDQLREIIKEFFTYTFDESELMEKLVKTETSEGFKHKLHDLCLIYSEYKKYVSEHYVSDYELLDLLAEAIKKSGVLDNAVFYIDSFYGFTPQELNIVRELLLKNVEISVVFSYDPFYYGFFDKHSQNATQIEKNIWKFSHADIKPFWDNNEYNRFDYFYASKRTLHKLDDIATELHIAVEDMIYFNEQERQYDKAEFLHLEKNCLLYNVKKYTEKPKNIEIFKAQNIYHETEVTAKKIIEYVRDYGYSFSDIVVLACPLEIYSSIVSAIFSKYEIPFFLNKSRDIIFHPLTELVRSAFHIVLENWSYESIFRLLKTGLTRLKIEHIYKLENYVLANGIKGGKWKREWKYGFEGGSEEFDERRMNVLKDLVINMLAPFTKKITAKKIRADQYTKIIYEFLLGLKITDKLNKWIIDAKNENDYELASLHTQIWEKILGLLDRINELIGDQKMSCEDFFNILDAGLCSVTLGVVPSTQDQVIVGDIKRSRFQDIKALFILGAREGSLPQKRDDNGIFSDSDREVLEKEYRLELCQPVLYQTMEDWCMLYNEFTKPTEKLIISFPAGELDGAMHQPSIVINKIFEMFTQLEYTDYIGIKNQASTKQAALATLAEHYEINSKNIVMDYIEKELCNDESYHKKIEKLKTIRDNPKLNESLSEKSIAALYKKSFRTSVTRIEKYIKCPFAYFAQYNLKAKERKVYEIQNVDAGNLYHETLDLFIKEIQNKNIDPSKISYNEIAKLSDSCVDQAVENNNEIFNHTPQYKNFLKKAKSISRTSLYNILNHIKSGDFVVGFSEMVFSDSNGADLNACKLILSDGTEMLIEGKIDRIDFLERKIKTLDTNDNEEYNLYVKVIDYKSGSDQFNYDEVYYGLQLQLLIYLYSFLNIYKLNNATGQPITLKPAGAFYFKVKEPIFEYSHTKKKSIEELISDYFTMSGVVLNDFDIASSIDKKTEPKKSNIIPVNLQKLDEEEAALEPKEFNSLLEYSVNEIKKAGDRIIDGDVSIKPYKFKKANGCDYCIYKHICRFDPVLDRERYRVFSDIDKKEARAKIVEGIWKT